MRQLRWSLDSLQSGRAAPALFEADAVSAARNLRTRYPICYLRYWFVACLLERLHAETGRKLRVLEVGIGRGQMLSFLHGPADGDGFKLPPAIARWDGLDVQVSERGVLRYGYTDYIEADIEAAPDLGDRRYDAIVLLHILEHLADPEAAMAHLARHLDDGGLLAGGSPTMPEWLARRYQPRLRRSYADRMHDVRLHKHLSVISPARLCRFAREQRFAIDLLAGTFFLRASGSPLESAATWVRLNLLWGALFPSLGGEVYFALRKRAR